MDVVTWYINPYQSDKRGYYIIEIGNTVGNIGLTHEDTKSITILGYITA